LRLIHLSGQSPLLTVEASSSLEAETEALAAIKVLLPGKKIALHPGGIRTASADQVIDQKAQLNGL
jgi:hypothetical protein